MAAAAIVTSLLLEAEKLLLRLDAGRSRSGATPDQRFGRHGHADGARNAGVRVACGAARRSWLAQTRSMMSREMLQCLRSTDCASAPADLCFTWTRAENLQSQCYDSSWEPSGPDVRDMHSTMHLELPGTPCTCHLSKLQRSPDTHRG